MSVQYAHIDGKSEVTKSFFYEQTAKWCSWHHEWHLRVFFLLCIHTPVTEKVLEFVQMEEYTSVFWSLWLNKHYWPTNKNDILIYFISCLQFNSCSERVWLCQLICTKSISFLNYLKLLLPGILTLYLIAGCNFKCICSKNIPKPTLAAIRSTSLCIFFAITHQIWILVKKQIPKDIWQTFTSCHLQPTRNFGTFWFLIHYYGCLMVSNCSWTLITLWPGSCQIWKYDISILPFTLLEYSMRPG